MPPGRTLPPGAPSAGPESVAVRAADGYALGAFVWRHSEGAGLTRSVVIVNAATSVRCSYYAAFAEFLFNEGFDVVTYDYRGIGASRPRSLRGFEASWSDWGSLDFEAMLQYAQRAFPGQPIDVVAHSIGGFVIGFARSSDRIRRIVTVGAQHAYWRDYAPEKRYRMLVKWHWFMPALTALVGYFPGRRLGWLEDTPRGVVRDWSRAGRRFVPAARGKGSRAEWQALMRPFASVTAAILALSVTDDEFGTAPATERLLGYFPRSQATHLRIAPQSVAQARIGHFSFFHGRHAASLWQIPLQWLRHGRLAADTPGAVVAHPPASERGR